MKINKNIKKQLENLENKIIVITGSTSGIGLETLNILSKTKATIVCGVRNIELAEKIKNNILSKNPNAKIENYEIDLADTTKIKNFAERVTKNHPDGIDALICNAGIFARPKNILKNSIEQHYFVNCIAPILLAKQLLPLLEHRKNSKLIFVSSISIKNKKIDFDDIDKKLEKNDIKTYANSKLWPTLYALQLKRQLTLSHSNVTVNIAHPGITATSLMNPKNGKFSKLTYLISNFGMNIIFPNKKKACLCEIYSLFVSTKGNEWIAPKIFQIWGYPKKKKILISKKTINLSQKAYDCIENTINNIKM